MGLLAPAASFAQFSTQMPSCPAGTKLERVEIWTETANINFNLESKLIGGGTLGFPIAVTRWKMVCVAPNEPPPPPPRRPPRKQPMEDILVQSGYVPWQDFVMHSAHPYSLSLVVPSFAELRSAQAFMDVSLIRANGSTATASFDLLRQGTEVFFASPSLVDNWTAMHGQNAVGGAFTVRGLTMTPMAAGRGVYGVVHYMGTQPVTAFSGTLTVGMSSGVPPRMSRV